MVDLLADFEASGSDREYSPSDIDESDIEVVPPPKKKRKVNCNKKKPKKSNSDPREKSSRKGGRSRKKTNRFGTRESTANFDTFFTNLTAENSVPSTIDDSMPLNETGSNTIVANCVDLFSTVSNNSPINEDENSSIFADSCGNQANASHQFDAIKQMMSDLGNCMKTLETNFDAKLQVFQRQLARVEVMMNHRRVSVDTDESAENEYLSELAALGLPLKTSDSLADLEKKLADASYENQLVRVKSILSEVLFIE